MLAQPSTRGGLQTLRPLPKRTTSKNGAARRGDFRFGEKQDTRVIQPSRFQPRRTGRAERILTAPSDGPRCRSLDAVLADRQPREPTVIRPTFYSPERLSVDIRVDVSDSPGMFVSGGRGGGEGKLVAAVQRDLARPVRAALQLETDEGNDAVDAD
jgi:hypothetical protein